jgi:hypothetical protein
VERVTIGIRRADVPPMTVDAHEVAGVEPDLGNARTHRVGRWV